jgi:hypothetical protein
LMEKVEPIEMYMKGTRGHYYFIQEFENGV